MGQLLIINSGGGKYIGFGLNGTERTTIVDIFNLSINSPESTRHRYSPERL